MSRNMHLYHALLASSMLILLHACAKPEAKIEGSNENAEVYRMVSFDDCTLYRVEGVGDTVFVARCGNQISTKRTVCYQCGKATCCDSKRVETVQVEGSQ